MENNKPVIEVMAFESKLDLAAATGAEQHRQCATEFVINESVPVAQSANGYSILDMSSFPWPSETKTDLSVKPPPSSVGPIWSCWLTTLKGQRYGSSSGKV
jgi:hypothetical protein